MAMVRSTVSTSAAAAVGLAGAGLIGLGLWGRREAECALARERIFSVEDAGRPSSPVTSPAAARSMAEVIRRNTVAATGERTYAEIGPYLDALGRPTADAALASRDERTGAPLENPEHDLWIQSITLQTALMQAYMGFRIAELTVGVGASMVAIGVGLAALGRRRP